MQTVAKCPQVEGLWSCEKKSFEVVLKLSNDGEYLIGRGEAEEKA